MKKALKKIAVIMILVMLCNSFAGCITMAFLGSGNPLVVFALPISLGLDLITSPIQLAIYAAEKKRYDELQEKAIQNDQIDTFASVGGSFPDIRLLSLRERFDSLPETEIAAYTRTVNSFTETELFAIHEAFNQLSAAEIASSIAALNSMSDETLIAALNNAHIEFRYHNERGKQ